jgi:hypothetical protein
LFPGDIEVSRAKKISEGKKERGEQVLSPVPGEGRSRVERVGTPNLIFELL